MTQIDRGVKFSASEDIARRIAAVAAGYIADYPARHQCKQILMHYAAGIESFDLQSLLRLMV